MDEDDPCESTGSGYVLCRICEECDHKKLF